MGVRGRTPPRLGNPPAPAWGLLVEPNPFLFKELVRKYRDWPNLYFAPVCACVTPSPPPPVGVSRVGGWAETAAPPGFLPGQRLELISGVWVEGLGGWRPCVGGFSKKKKVGWVWVQGKMPISLVTECGCNANPAQQESGPQFHGILRGILHCRCGSSHSHATWHVFFPVPQMHCRWALGRWTAI